MKITSIFFFSVLFFVQLRVGENPQPKREFVIAISKRRMVNSSLARCTARDNKPKVGTYQEHPRTKRRHSQPWCWLWISTGGQFETPVKAGPSGRPDCKPTRDQVRPHTIPPPSRCRASRYSPGSDSARRDGSRPDMRDAVAKAAWHRLRRAHPGAECGLASTLDAENRQTGIPVLAFLRPNLDLIWLRTPGSSQSGTSAS